MHYVNKIINDKNFTVTFAIDKNVVNQREKDGLGVLLITYTPNQNENLLQQHCEDIVNDMYKDILISLQTYIDSEPYEDYKFKNKISYIGLTARNEGFKHYVNDISFAID